MVGAAILWALSGRDIVLSSFGLKCRELAGGERRNLFILSYSVCSRYSATRGVVEAPKAGILSKTVPTVCVSLPRRNLGKGGALCVCG